MKHKVYIGSPPQHVCIEYHKLLCPTVEGMDMPTCIYRVENVYTDLVRSLLETCLSLIKRQKMIAVSLLSQPQLGFNPSQDFRQRHVAFHMGQPTGTIPFSVFVEMVHVQNVRDFFHQPLHHVLLASLPCFVHASVVVAVFQQKRAPQIL